jgi:hypothetical protein
MKKIFASEVDNNTGMVIVWAIYIFLLMLT